MKSVTSRLVALFAVLFALVMVMTVFSATVSANAQVTSPRIWTDRSAGADGILGSDDDVIFPGPDGVLGTSDDIFGDYMPGEIVTIYGSGFGTSLQSIDVTVVRPDGDYSTYLVYGMTYDYAGPGTFVCYYQLDGIPGTYSVTATDGSLSAFMTFTDGAGWEQGQNDDNNDNVPDGTLIWVTGNLGKTKQVITEGNYPPTYPPRVPGQLDYRAIFSELPAGSYSWIIRYQFTDTGHVAFDFLTTSYALTNDDSDLYQGLTGNLRTKVSNLVAVGPDIYGFPDDFYALVSPALGGGDVEDRQTVHDSVLDGYDGVSDGYVGDIPVRSLRMYGADITNIVQGSPIRDDSHNSEAKVTVYFTVPSGTNGVVVATWAGHLGIGKPAPAGYGIGNGAEGISGSPYHMMFGGVFYQYDPPGKDGIGDPVSSQGGDQDRSMSAEAVFILGKVSGYKWNDANANGVKDGDELGLSGWTILLDNSAGTIHLTATTGTDGYYEFDNVPVGSFTLSEQLKPGWIQTYPNSPGTYPISVTDSGQVFSGRNFGNHQLHPAIEVTKTADKSCAQVGETVTYTITVTNPASADIAIDYFTVSDALIGWSQLWGTTGGQDPTLDLAPGQSVVFHPTKNMPAQTADFVNTAAVTGYDMQGHEVTDLTPGSWTVDIVHPDVQITKTADKPTAHEGDLVTYTITVTNPTTADISIDWFIVSDDDILPAWSQIWGKAGGQDPTLDLAPGESVVFHPTMTMPVGDHFDNTARVTAYDMQGHEVKDDVQCKVVIIHPGISVTKVDNKDPVHVGDLIVYTIYVYNTGDCDLQDVVVQDAGATINIGNLPFKGSAGPFTQITHLVVGGDAPQYTNTATVSGQDSIGGAKGIVTGQAVETTDVLIPGIDVTKTGPLVASKGQVITYTIVVTNTGNCPLYDVTVVDNLLGTLWAAADHHTLAVGESKTFTPTYTVGIATGEVLNTVTASGSDALGKTVSGTASWTVHVESSWLTDTSDCRIPVTGFRIVFTPSGTTYKISSTNPGGFYYNILYNLGASPAKLTYTLGDNFVTWGSNPVHVYIWNDKNHDGSVYNAAGCLDWTEMTDVTNQIKTQQDPGLPGGTIQFSNALAGKNVYIAIHSMFLPKHTGGYSSTAANAFAGVYTFSATNGVTTQATLTATVSLNTVRGAASVVAGVQGGLDLAQVAGVTILLAALVIGALLGPTSSRIEGNGRRAPARAGKSPARKDS